jgi:hypothetical protein
LGGERINMEEGIFSVLILHWIFKIILLATHSFARSGVSLNEPKIRGVK